MSTIAVEELRLRPIGSATPARKTDPGQTVLKIVDPTQKSGPVYRFNELVTTGPHTVRLTHGSSIGSATGNGVLGLCGFPNESSRSVLRRGHAYRKCRERIQSDDGSVTVRETDPFDDTPRMVSAAREASPYGS